MGFETNQLRKIGFAQDRVLGQEAPAPNVSAGGAVSYAAALNASMPSHRPTSERATEPVVELAPKKIDKRYKSNEEAQTYDFPALAVIRRFDRSQATAPWRRFESALAQRFEAVGMQALKLSDMHVVLIGEDNFQSAMQQRYAYASRLFKPGLRHKEARAVTANARRVIDTATRQHQSNVFELTAGESYNLSDRMSDPEDLRWLNFDLDQIEAASSTYGVTPGEVVSRKADGLWQAYATPIESFGVTGPRSYGAFLGDPLGVLRTEAETIGRELSSKSYTDFSSSHFRIAKSLRWKLDLAVTDTTDLRYLPPVRIPEGPYDLPLRPPQIVSMENGRVVL